MGNPAGIKRNFDVLEKRGMQAAKILKEGAHEAEVARRVGVHRQLVNRWARQLSESGVSGLKKAGRAGRKPRSSETELDNIREALGYETSLWTAWRVADLIERECGIRYHSGHVWKVLKKLGWSCQKPTPPELWSAMKMQWAGGKRSGGLSLIKAQLKRQTIVSVDKSGWSERPHRFRTWASRGQTPVVEFHFN